jgi:hypothetical protein
MRPNPRCAASTEPFGNLRPTRWGNSGDLDSHKRRRHLRILQLRRGVASSGSAAGHRSPDERNDQLCADDDEW